jgi:uncharacterized NAD-dependent epimerase/dehydratase family protein
MLGRRRRLALLAEGSFSARDAKTAVGVLRYRTELVAAVIDSTRAGTTTDACVGLGGGIPVVADLAGAADAGADTLLIGIAPQGGSLPDAWRATVVGALDRGWDVISGLHAFLADDLDLSARAARTGARIHDVRRPAPERRIAAARARDVDALVVLTVGSDCNVGKMTVALELERELSRRGVRAAFVATGQTGIMIAGGGAPVDAIPSDFVAGAVESLVLEAAGDSDIVLVEGQGALAHPGYSGVTLGLLHGACPSALVLCHWAGRTRMRTSEYGAEVPIPSLAEVRDQVERAAGWVAPAVTVAAALNTLDLDPDAARAACTAAERELGVPAGDPVRFGAGPLADALQAAADRRRRARGVS